MVKQRLGCVFCGGILTTEIKLVIFFGLPSGNHRRPNDDCQVSQVISSIVQNDSEASLPGVFQFGFSFRATTQRNGVRAHPMVIGWPKFLTMNFNRSATKFSVLNYIEAQH